MKQTNKRAYVAPAMEVVTINMQPALLAASDGVYSRGMRYGGIDTYGEEDPD